jgi:ABC-type nitrate/sulfonate/bicarbonate transport system substrate-binding protein
MTMSGLALAFALSSCGNSDPRPVVRSTENLDPVEFALDWSGPEYLGFYTAQTMGYYADRGLNVTLMPGAGSAATARGILDGDIGFGTVSANAVIREIIDRAGPAGVSADSIPRIPAIIFPHSPSVIITARNRRISTPQDLAGLKIGYTSEVSEAFRQFKEFLGLNPGLEEKITLKEFLLEGARQLQSGEIDALVTYMMDVPPGLELDGFEYNATLLSDLGLVVPSQCIIVGSGAQVAPETVTAVIEASCEGWEYVRRNQTTAAKLYDKMLPGQDLRKIEIVARHTSDLLPPPSPSSIAAAYTDPALIEEALRRSVDAIVDARNLGWGEVQRQELVSRLTGAEVTVDKQKDGPPSDIPSPFSDSPPPGRSHPENESASPRDPA